MMWAADLDVRGFGASYRPARAGSNPGDRRRSPSARIGFAFRCPFDAHPCRSSTPISCFSATRRTRSRRRSRRASATGAPRRRRPAPDAGLPGRPAACPTWASPKRRPQGARTLVVGVANRGGVISPAWLRGARGGAGRSGSTSPRACTACCATSPSSPTAAAWRTGRRAPRRAAARRSASRSPTAERAPRPAAARRGHRLLGRQDVHRARAGARDAGARHEGDFRATGQTGILIAGAGVPLDAVVADFIAGAIEWLTPGQRPRPLGPDRGPGLPLPSLLCRRDAGAAARRPARRFSSSATSRPARTCAACPAIALPVARGTARPVARRRAHRQPGGPRGRRLDQHRRAARARRSTPREPSRRSWACRRSIPSGRAPAPPRGRAGHDAAA